MDVGADDLVDPPLIESAAATQRPSVLETADGDRVPFPLLATDASVLGAMFSIPLEQAWALLPATERLVPLRVTPRRAAVSLFAWQVRRGTYGAYHEVGVAIPVLLDAPKPPAPAPPSLWRDPAIGYYAVELPVDSERVAQAGAGLMGLPHVVGEATMEIGERGGRATLALDGSPTAELAVHLGRWPHRRRVDLSFQSYSLLGGRIVRTRYLAVGDGYRGRRGTASVSFGERPRRVQRLARLQLSRRPLELRVVSRMNWIAAPPEDAGAV
ncbi:MAG: acetoacetate decarboxylase family protein [Solirubrobacteraceae bacterium]|nr:acetoacetate decarboxylase family protein [Solirubrobacteraceae bacterium]